MFKFLKDKLKKAVSKLSKDVEVEAEDVGVEIPDTVEEEIPEDVVPNTHKVPEKKKEIAKDKEETEDKKGGEEDDYDKPVPPHLAGLKETLDSYSDEQLDRLMELLAFKKDDFDGLRHKRIRKILEMPISEVSSAMDKLEGVDDAGVKQAEEELHIGKESVEEKKSEEKNEKEDRETEEKILEEETKEMIEESADEEEISILEEERKEKKKGFFSRVFGKKKEDAPEPPAFGDEETKKESKTVKRLKDIDEELKIEDTKIEDEDHTLEEDEKRQDEKQKVGLEEAEEQIKIKKGLFGKLKEGFVMKKLSDSKFEDIFFDMEVALLENNVAVEVIEKIKNDMKSRLVEQKVKRSDIEETIMDSLISSLDEILDGEQPDILSLVKKKKESGKPLVIAFVGINGSGKTTTIAKVTKMFMDNHMKPVLVAADTFRAAAIQQLEEHAKNLGVKIIKHDYGSDPAAVAFDGIKYAEAKELDVVLIDTAGRLHSNTNLMDEMKKIMRVANPDLKIFVGESITGNDCIEQAQKFNEAIELDGIILSKADVDEKGGAAISVSYVTGKPILFIGTGQTYDDLTPFSKKIVMDNLGLTD